MTRSPCDLRAIVVGEIARQKRSRSWLADHEDLTCSRDAILRWLRGETDLGAEHAGECLAVLGLRVRATARAGTPRPGRAASP
jgi:hypothetical protein